MWNGTLGMGVSVRGPHGFGHVVHHLTWRKTLESFW